MLKQLFVLGFFLLKYCLCQEDKCQLYSENVQCQDALNCEGLDFECEPDASNIDPSKPCPGVKLELFKTDDDFCGWCSSSCVQTLEEGQTCRLTTNGGEVYSMCGPGLRCLKEAGDTAATCRSMVTPCVTAQKAYDAALETGQLGMDVLRPQCDTEGDWAPVQCTGSDVCRCVSKTTGEPIFGLSTNMTSVDLDLMTCNCARDSHMMREMACAMEVKWDGETEAGRRRYTEAYTRCMESEEAGYYSGGHLRCQQNGNYDEAQCVQQTYDDSYLPAHEQEVCFCYQDGKEIDSLAPISIAATVLECHREDEDSGHVEGYYRGCEARLEALRKKISKHKYEGHTFISSETLPRCSIDGFYDKLQRDSENGERGFCSHKEGKQIENYEGTFANMDCECAVVESMISGWGLKPSCTEDGSYNKKQCKGGKCYCVDRYGRQCEKEKSDSELISCDDAGDADHPDKAPKACPT